MIGTAKNVLLMMYNYVVKLSLHGIVVYSYILHTCMYAHVHVYMFTCEHILAMP